MTTKVIQGLDDPSKPSPSQPVVARMYDWYLGGTHSYEIDRKAAEAVERSLPDIKPLVVENRSFLRRAVRYLAKKGYTQFIDIGSGLPTVGNTHEAVLKVNPKARILYVDIEESAVNEGKQYINETGWADQVGMIQASALQPQTIFDDLETKRIVDFNKPVVILKIALVHFFDLEQYVPIMNFWKTNLVKGSTFVMSHGTWDDRDEEQIRGAVDIYSRTPTPVIFRTRAEIEPIMDGWQLIDPGLVKAHAWKMEELEQNEEAPPRTEIWYVAVGKLT